MARRSAQARAGDLEQNQENQVSSEQRAPSHGQESTPGTDEKLRLAREKVTHMEETQRLCFRHQNNLETLATELQKLDRYTDYEITQLLEPKGPRSIPGYLKSEIERQKQYVAYLSARVKPAESHTAGIDQQQSTGDELARS